MFDLLTKEEDVVAASRGWALNYVYDIKLKRWAVMVFPTSAALSVLNAARALCPLSIKAVRLAAAPVIRKPQHERRTRATQDA